MENTRTTIIIELRKWENEDSGEWHVYKNSILARNVAFWQRYEKDVSKIVGLANSGFLHLNLCRLFKTISLQYLTGKLVNLSEELNL